MKTRQGTTSVAALNRPVQVHEEEAKTGLLKTSSRFLQYTRSWLQVSQVPGGEKVVWMCAWSRMGESTPRLTWR